MEVYLAARSQNLLYSADKTANYSFDVWRSNLGISNSAIKFVYSAAKSCPIYLFSRSKNLEALDKYAK